MKDMQFTQLLLSEALHLCICEDKEREFGIGVLLRFLGDLT